MKLKHRKMNPSEAELRVALNKIAKMGQGIPEKQIDWANIGKNAVYVAQQAMKDKCVECGK